MYDTPIWLKVLLNCWMERGRGNTQIWSDVRGTRWGREDFEDDTESKVCPKIPHTTAWEVGRSEWPPVCVLWPARCICADGPYNTWQVQVLNGDSVWVGMLVGGGGGSVTETSVWGVDSIDAAPRVLSEEQGSFGITLGRPKLMGQCTRWLMLKAVG